MAVKTTRYRRHMVASGSFGCSWAATKWTRTPDQILVSPVVASSRNSDQTFKPDQRHAKKLKRTPGSYKVTASWPSPSRSRRNRCRANWPVPPTFVPLGVKAARSSAVLLARPLLIVVIVPPATGTTWAWPRARLDLVTF